MPYNILIVDDSATTRAMIKRTIKLAQVPAENLFEAENGQAALDVLENVHVDLVVADLNMPTMNGFEMTRRMIANPATSSIPVVLVSAEPNAVEFAENHGGIKACLPKPFAPEDMRAVIQKVLEGQPHA